MAEPSELVNDPACVVTIVKTCWAFAVPQTNEAAITSANTLNEFTLSSLWSH